MKKHNGNQDVNTIAFGIVQKVTKVKSPKPKKKKAKSKTA
jgi:hypothetical protein